ncbi:rab3 GTPase-activating protein non-catalytic subunit isoform X2 [Dermacentor silvarum]|uniref:rab3 GTPase-activating protein non-catalytic subunit isoform X2 n=1 Tax=Dermacentor silvarum TaxID=543639 RepID=UPI001896CD6D|nr:rab3 GTPase-activating protein non-catalytic subunit isoform X2 [Dermacentor silvarum]
MSCQLVKIAAISNVARVKSYLFPSGQEQQDDAASKATSDAWDWPLENEQPTEAKSTKEEDKWLQDCVVALSSTADVLALARENTVVFLTAKHGISERNDWKYEVSFHSQLRASNSDPVCAMLCLPMSSQKSYQGGPDWTCIVVGFKSGYVHMYTEDGRLLLNQLLHEEPVLSLKCQTYVPRRFSGFGEQQDEVRVTYPHAIVCLEGFGLFQTLRACRNQLARGGTGNQGPAVTPPPLSYKKWGPQDIRHVRDCEAVGTVAPRLFDQMVIESIRKAHGGIMRFSAASSSLICATGTDPYVGFYYAKEGFVQPHLTDVAVAVASRVKTFLADSLLGKLTKTQQEEVKAPPIEPASGVPMRCGIFDKHRKGMRIFLSPSKQLAAVTDSLGRIVLFSVFQNTATRIWKGYRDAECGWVEVEDSSPDTAINGVPRRTQFLIVYAPRWGVIEVWCPHQSSRVAAFEVGKGGRLLYTNYTLVGLNNVLVKTVRPNTYPCCYMTSEGKLYAVAVPFHRVLSERSRARDWQLLNEVQVLLKEADPPIDEGECWSQQAQLVTKLGRLLRDMKAVNVQQQALEKIVHSSKASHFVVSTVLGVLEPKSQEPQASEDEEVSCDFDAELLHDTCRRLRQLCRLHKAVDKSQVDDIYEPSSEEVSPEELADELSMPLKKVSRVLTHVSRYLSLWTAGSSKRVTFGDENPVALPVFLGYFDIGDSRRLARDRNDEAPLPVTTKADADCKQLGHLLFSRALASSGCHPLLLEALRKSGIAPSSLVQSLLQEWLSSTWAMTNKRSWCLFSSLLKSLVEMAGEEAHFTASLTMSPWWRSIRTVLAASSNVPAAYIGAAIVGYVARSFLQFPSPQKDEATDAAEKVPQPTEENEDKPLEKLSGPQLPPTGDRDDPVIINDEGEIEEDSWEPVVIECDHWESLLGKLEDVLVLASLLRRPCDQRQLFPEHREVSLSSLFTRGQGIITELVSAWACDLDMTPDDLRRLTKLPLPTGSESQEDGIDLHFVRARRRFARSLELDSLLVNCASEQLVRWDRDRDQIDKLAKASAFLSAVSSSILKNGVGLIIWKTFLQKRFEALVLLMEKMGKTPKDRICRRDVEISDIHLEPFVRFCTEVLEAIVDASLGPEAETLPVLPQGEPLWEGAQQDASRPQPLVAHALGQRAPNMASVRHHQLLATVVQFVVLFGMRSVRPLSLFTPTVRKAFFQDLHSPLLAPSAKISSSLTSSPQQSFLLRAASAVMQSLPDNPDNSVLGTTFGWMNRLLDLACSWGEDRDLVRRHCVCELYSAGHDILAQEVSLAVKDKAQLASCLLVIAGQRMHHLLFMNDAHRPSQMALLSPHISTWILSLDLSNLRCCNPPTLQTMNLLQNIVNMLPEDHSEHRLALSLLDVLESLPEPS